MKTIGIISGHFSPFHEGHLDYITEARSLCDQLYIIVNNNKQLLLKKGFCFQDEKFRCRLLTNLIQTYCVYLSCDQDLSVSKTLEQIILNNQNRTTKFLFLNGGDVKTCREEEVCKKYECEIVYGVGGEKIGSSKIYLGEIMHYRNGREAKNGDKIVKLEGGKVVSFGVLHGAVPGNDHCNGNIAVVQSHNDYACLCDCLHVDDVQILLKEKNLDKRPIGK